MKEVKFISTDEGEYAFILHDDKSLEIMDVDNDIKEKYSKEVVEELFGFLDDFL